ncbi:stalk domain-containing protein [Paenibacillus sp. L3-i20]|uniref:stalk domain-containing protein n=1 Tax=Paenibacillus sp. L3-i20 TaxID=2905833 RepID=UPI001EDECADE|nr:stalk domain-containing protein [Paenibacillus sp. L3-i20]GKU79044.1 hypothetical protein L3i20_v234410 [Paenibacillus sp. L3-i20]
MKRFLIGFICGSMIFGGTTILAANANEIKAKLNSAILEFNGSMKASTDSIHYEGTTYVPLRDFSKTIGATILHDTKTKTFNIIDRYYLQKQDISYFVQIPVSIQQKNIEVTVNSIESNNDSTIVNVTVENKSKQKYSIDEANIHSDFGVKGGKSRHHKYIKETSFILGHYGSYDTSKKRDFDKDIEAGTTLTGNLVFEKVDPATQTIVLTLGSSKSTSWINDYTFMINYNSLGSR